MALYALELGCVGLALALYKYGDRLSSLSARQAGLLLGFLAIAAGAGMVVVTSFRAFRRPGTRTFESMLVLNLVTVVLIFGFAETAVRLLSVDAPAGRTFAGTRLVPRSWTDTKVRAAKLIEAALPATAYFVSDTLLGWTIGPSRRSKDGMYLSSAEGIRSPRTDVKYAGEKSGSRVAIIGDSFTFSEDGPFVDSWGLKLEELLEGRAKVLNFGVPGHGVDQAYLHYGRDVQPWHPAVTVLGFINHDLIRSLAVYWLISSPDWGFPFAKPRFALAGGQPKLLNVPLISAESILSKSAVSDLPFVGYDPGYDANEWRWRFYHSSYLVRYLLGRFPRYSVARDETGDRALREINTRLLVDFAHAAAESGTVPVVAYYPSRSDFDGLDLSAKDSVLAGLQRAGVPFVDLTSCIRAVGPEKAFIPGKRHYSAAGNAAVAQCLLPTVVQGLGGTKRPAN